LIERGEVAANRELEDLTRELRVRRLADLQTAP
jgi:hypothetical protein